MHRGGQRIAHFVLGLLMLGLAGCNPAPPTPPTDTPSPSPQAEASVPAGVPLEAALADLDQRLQAEFEIEGEPDWLAEGFGSVWVSRTDPEGEGNLLDRIDPSTNEVVASIDVGRNPCHGLAVGFGSVWVPTCIDQQLERIDPQRNRVQDSIDVPLHRVDGDRLVAAFGALRIASPDPKGGDTVARIDPTTGRIDHIPLPSLSTEITSGFGSLWVMSPEGGVVHRIDPSGMRVAGAIEGLTEPETAVAAGDSLWIKDAGNGTIARVDPESLEVIEKIEIGTPGIGGGIAAGDGDLWFRPANYLLGRLDASTSAVTEVFGEPPALGDVLVAFGSVWFSGYTKDTVWRVSP